jgi:hypothetical protein
VIEQDVRVLEEPRGHEEHRRYPQESAVQRDGEDQGKDDDDGRGAGAGWAEEVGGISFEYSSLRSNA